MNYRKHYDALMLKAKSRLLESEYTESHHILPRCMGGSNSIDNLVELTYKEHYLAHWLLCKIHPDNPKLFAALVSMSGNPLDKRVIPAWVFDLTKRMAKDKGYPWLKEYANKHGAWNKGTKGVMKAWNKGMKLESHSEARKKQISETLKEHWTVNGHNRIGMAPWNKGTKGVMVAWNKGKKADLVPCLVCGKMANAGNISRWHNEKCKNTINKR